MSEVPAGFEPSRRTSPFLDMIGPVYTVTGERGILLGLRARSEHCNANAINSWSVSSCSWNACPSLA